MDQFALILGYAVIYLLLVFGVIASLILAVGSFCEWAWRQRHYFQLVGYLWVYLWHRHEIQEWCRQQSGVRQEWIAGCLRGDNSAKITK
jgi:hypothetical protein